ncbi:MAG: hypothetical protein ACT4O5_12415 [Gammaproteobacteria bacterium]
MTDCTRREFLMSTAGAALLPAAARSASTQPERMVGIQIGAVSFLDEGTEQALDTVQERGAVNTLFVASFSYGRGLGGRQVQREALPDHGKQEYDLDFHGGNFATPHAKYYSRTSLKQTRAPDYGDYDVLADVVPKAHRRRMKVYVFYEDRFREGLPGMADLREVDFSGQRARYMLCPLHPDYREFILGLTRDYCESYEIDGLMWSSERQGPLHNAISAESKAGVVDDRARVGCFCEFHRKAGQDRGIDFGRAKEGYAKLDRYLRAAHAGRRPNDGHFVEFWRLLLEYPELLAWEKLWTDSKHALYADIFHAAKKSRPDVQVGFHLWGLNSFSPFFRAEQNYAQFARFSDFLKVVIYNTVGGPRYATAIENINATVFRDLPPEEVHSLYNSWLGYGEEVSLEKLPYTGLSADFVERETKRALAAVTGTHCRIYAGIGIDIPPTGRDVQSPPADLARSTPAAVGASTSAALEAGARGVIFSRKYSEMRLANLAAAGNAVRRFSRT